MTEWSPDSQVGRVALLKLTEAKERAVERFHQTKRESQNRLAARGLAGGPVAVEREKAAEQAVDEFAQSALVAYSKCSRIAMGS